jgi:hypothetical protein
VFVVTVCVHVAVLGPAGWLALPCCAGRSSASRGCAAAGLLWRGRRARCLLCRARAWPWSQSGRYRLYSSAALPTPSVGRHRQAAVCVRGRVGLRCRARLTASARTLASRHHAVSCHGYDGPELCFFPLPSLSPPLLSHVLDVGQNEVPSSQFTSSVASPSGHLALQPHPTWMEPCQALLEFSSPLVR